MKIIRQGIAPPQRAFKMLCGNCGCVFEATRQEFIYVQDLNNGDYWEIKCPTEDCVDTLYRYGWDD